MSSTLSLNGRRVRGTNPITLNSAILDNKRIAYSPRSYSIFDVNDTGLKADIIKPTDNPTIPDNPPILEEFFAWVEGDTLYLSGSSVSVMGGELVMETEKARVESDTLYLVR